MNLRIIGIGLTMLAVYSALMVYGIVSNLPSNGAYYGG